MDNTLQLDVYKFNPQAADQPADILEQRKEKVAKELLEHPGSWEAEQFWLKGFVDIAGYRYEPVNTNYVLISSYGHEWYEHATPSTDPAYVRQYVKEHCSDDCSYIILDGTVKIHCT